MNYTTESNVRHYTRYLKHGKNIDRAFTRLLEEDASYSIFHHYDTKKYASNYKHDRKHEEQARRLIKTIERLQEESEERAGKTNQKNRRDGKRHRDEEKGDRRTSHNTKSLAELMCENVTLDTLKKHRPSMESLSGEALLRVVGKNREISKSVDHMFRQLIKKEFPHRCYLLEEDKGHNETYKDVYERFVKDQKSENRKEGPPSKKYKDHDGKVMYRVENINFGEDDDDDFM